MKPSLKIDVSEFRKAAPLYLAATKKDEAEMLNRAGRNGSLRASQNTPKTVGSKIKSELVSNDLAVRILSARGRFRGVSVADRKRITKRFINARVRSARYIAAGWAKAIRAFGGRGQTVNPKSEAAKGYGIKATSRRLMAEIANNSRGAGKVGLKPLQDAINFVARDMTQYALRKMSRTANRFSARGAR